MRARVHPERTALEDGRPGLIVHLRSRDVHVGLPFTYPAVPPEVRLYEAGTQVDEFQFAPGSWTADRNLVEVIGAIAQS